MTAPNFSLHALTSLQDALLLPWLDLYETAFPPHEKMLVSEHLKILRQKEAGLEGQHHLLAVLDQHAHFAGLLRYQVLPEVGAAYLWYLAIEPRLRNSGLGSRVYQALIQRLVDAHLKMLVFEVEIPELQQHEAGQGTARRRIGFYQRQGARLVHGVDYLQYVGSHQPPTPMHLMVHPLVPLSPGDAFELAKFIFKDALRQVGDLRLE